MTSLKKILYDDKLAKRSMDDEKKGLQVNLAAEEKDPAVKNDWHDLKIRSGYKKTYITATLYLRLVDRKLTT